MLFCLLLFLIRFDSSIYGFILFGRVRVGFEDSGDDDDDGGECGGGGDSKSQLLFSSGCAQNMCRLV